MGGARSAHDAQPGTCNTMGTASTMTAIAEALGLALPGAPSIPAMDAGHPRMAADCGERIVADGLGGPDARAHPHARLVRQRAVAVQMALGGSTNAAVHLIAMARRAGVALTLDDMDARGRRDAGARQPVPRGEYLMEDFYYAGGLPALLNASARPARRWASSPSTAGRWARTSPAPQVLERRRHPPARPPGHRDATAALAVLRGNLAPDGAVIKPSAADAAASASTAARALVFDSHAEMLAAHRRPRRCDVDRGHRAGAAQRRPGRRARACPNGATCRSRRSCCSRACATWCASVRRAHERHALRHLRAARRARKRGRRAAGAGARPAT